MEGLRRFLEEDAPAGDVTSELLVPEGAQARAVLSSGNAGVLAGAEEAAWLFRDGGLEVGLLLVDGSQLAAGDEVMKVEGDLRQILLRERTCLNIMMMMSGVATVTRDVLERCRAVNPAVTLAATRKTLPGLRSLQKKAVSLGGGEPHRMSLSDHIMVKDNHIDAAGGMNKALGLLKGRRPGTVVVEAEELAAALAAASWGADVVMLDNMTPEEARRSYRRIKEEHPYVMVEASGGIGPEEAPAYADAADRVSMGFLTHSAPSLQFSLHLL